ncbi:hypothetical protein BDZ91DRAFT_784165 [Kalaharituber pfeilii]|nr:hypothetical protein BDZ91DRAFT_784165 [Kalaharituber pfeilii]
MPSKFHVRERIHKLFHHSSRKSHKRGSSLSSLSTVNSCPTTRKPKKGIDLVTPNLPIPDHATQEHPQLQLEFARSESLFLSPTLSTPEGAPLGAGLEDALYPPSNESVIHSSDLSDTDLYYSGNLGPPPARAGAEGFHPGSEIPASPIGEDPPILPSMKLNKRRTESEHEGYFMGYFPPTEAATSDSSKQTETTIPEASCTIYSPIFAQYPSFGRDKAALALESERLRRAIPLQKTKLSETSEGKGSTLANRVTHNYSSSDSSSIYSKNCRGPGEGSHLLILQKATRAHVHTLMEASADIDVIALDENQGVIPHHSSSGGKSPDAIAEQYRQEPSESERGYNLSEHAYSHGQSSTYVSHPVEARLRSEREESITTGATSSSATLGEPITIPGVHYHEAEIYTTHVPSTTTTTEKHVTYNPPIVHEYSIPQHHDIRTSQVTREVHTHEIQQSILPVLKTEYLPIKHVVERDDGTVEDITAEQAAKDGYSVVKQEDRVVTPARIMNVEEFAEQVRQMEKRGSSNGNSEAGSSKGGDMGILMTRTGAHAGRHEGGSESGSLRQQCEENRRGTFGGANFEEYNFA